MVDLCKLVFVFYCRDKHHAQAQLGEEKVYFHLQLIVHLEGKSGQELEAGIEEEAMEEHYLLFAPYCLLSLLSFTT